MSPAVKSVARAFAVLEMFDRARRPLTLKDVRAALGYAPSSGAALLKSLVALGYLDYDRRTRSYFPTMRIAFLGQWVEEALFGDGAILRLMKRLHRVTGEAVMLAAQSDLDAQYIHTVHGAEILQAAVPPGTLRPLANSGVGWLLLSRLDDGEIERLCRRIDIAQGRRVDRAALRKAIAAARRDGYVFSRHTVARGTGIIAMLLPQSALGRTFAIGVAGTVALLEQKQAMIVAALRRGVRGFEGPPKTAMTRRVRQ